MFRIREVAISDLDSLWELVCQASIGMTSLQIDKETLSDRLERSVFAFQRTSQKAEGAPYVFVLEDLSRGAIAGTSCIFSKTGGFEPFYSYRVETQKTCSDLLSLTTLVHSLHLVKEHNGPTEIGGLFLLPDYRGRGCGKLLSLCRFLYMAAYPKRFDTTTIAEMRGYQTPNSESPFWNAIGAHFFKIDFPQADSLSMVNKRFIEDLMPKHPIYLELLPRDALEAIGKVHPHTEPALAMLEAQGFRRNDLIDIFDGGPIVSCPTQEIKAVRNTQTVPWQHDPTCERDRTAIVARSNRPFLPLQTSIAWVDDHTNEGVASTDNASNHSIPSKRIAVLDVSTISDLELRADEKILVLELDS